MLRAKVSTKLFLRIVIVTATSIGTEPGAYFCVDFVLDSIFSFSFVLGKNYYYCFSAFDTMDGPVCKFRCQICVFVVAAISFKCAKERERSVPWTCSFSIVHWFIVFTFVQFSHGFFSSRCVRLWHRNKKSSHFRCFVECVRFFFRF